MSTDHATTNASQFSQRLNQAIEVGMVRVSNERGLLEAWIMAPPHPEQLTDDDWLLLIAAGTEMSRELRELGFEVRG